MASFDELRAIRLEIYNKKIKQLNELCDRRNNPIFICWTMEHMLNGRSSCLPIPGTQDVISRNDMCLKCWSIMGDSNLYEVLDILCTKCENTFTINNNGYGFIISEIAKECKKCDTCSKLFI